MPPGLTLASSGLVSGTPLSPGIYQVEFLVSDSAGRSGGRAFEITVFGPTPTLLPGMLPNGLLGQPYSATFSVSNGTGTYTFSSTQGIPGLSINSATGVYSGTPTQVGIFVVKIVATGATTVQATYYVTIAGTSGDTLIVSPGYLPTATVALPYETEVYLTDPNLPLAKPAVWTISNGTLPPGLTQDPSLGDRIIFRGIPTTAGTYPFHLQGKDSLGHTGSTDYSLKVENQPIQINPTGLPDGLVGVPYSTSFSASGGTPPYTYSAEHRSTGSLSLAIWVGANGVMQFTPNSAGRGDFFVTATDSVGLSSVPRLLPNGYHLFDFRYARANTHGRVEFQLFRLSRGHRWQRSLHFCGVVRWPTSRRNTRAQRNYRWQAHAGGTVRIHRDRHGLARCVGSTGVSMVGVRGVPHHRTTYLAGCHPGRLVFRSTDGYRRYGPLHLHHAASRALGRWIDRAAQRHHFGNTAIQWYDAEFHGRRQRCERLRRFPSLPT